MVERAARGDHAAYAALVEPLIPRLYGLAGLVLGDPGAAEDVVQDALLRAWRDLASLRDSDRFEAWVRRLVVNASHDEGRRRRRRGTPLRLDAGLEPPTDDGLADLVRRDELAGAFRQLSSDDRVALALRYYLDLPSAEAARAAGVGEVAFRSRVHRALRRLRAAIVARGVPAVPIAGSGMGAS